MLQMTKHAHNRMNQRGINQDDIDFVRHFGRIIYQAGAKFYFLGKRDIPYRYARSHGHLEGTTLVVCPVSYTLVTCYRNREAHADIKRRSKRDLRGVARCA